MRTKVRLNRPARVRRAKREWTNVPVGGSMDHEIAARKAGHRHRAVATWQRQLAMDAAHPRTRGLWAARQEG